MINYTKRAIKSWLNKRKEDAKHLVDELYPKSEEGRDHFREDGSFKYVLLSGAIRVLIIFSCNIPIIATSYLIQLVFPVSWYVTALAGASLALDLLNYSISYYVFVQAIPEIVLEKREDELRERLKDRFGEKIYNDKGHEYLKKLEKDFNQAFYGCIIGQSNCKKYEKFAERLSKTAQEVKNSAYNYLGSLSYEEKLELVEIVVGHKEEIISRISEKLLNLCQRLDVKGAIPEFVNGILVDKYNFICHVRQKDALTPQSNQSEPMQSAGPQTMEQHTAGPQTLSMDDLAIVPYQGSLLSRMSFE